MSASSPDQPSSSTVANVPSTPSSSVLSALSPPLPRPYPRIDIHTHILPEHIPDLHRRYGYGEWVRLEHHCDCRARMYQGSKFFREVEENCYRGSPRIADCDASDVTVQVLSTVPVMFSYWAKPEDTLDLAVFLNDHIHSLVAAHPTRFLGLCTIPMQDASLAIQELSRCMQLGSFVGVQIGSHVNDMPLSDERLFPIFEACERLGACVFVHPWDMAGTQLMSKYWLPWLVGMPAETSFAICSFIFGGLFRRLPNLKVCFAHGGGSFPGTIGRIEHGWQCRSVHSSTDCGDSNTACIAPTIALTHQPTSLSDTVSALLSVVCFVCLCRPDLVAVDNPTNPRSYCGHFYVDSLTHDETALLAIRDLFGPQRIVLGSDYPFPLGEDRPGQLVAGCSRLTEEEKEAILWRNAVSFLGIQKKERRLLGLDEEEPAGATSEDSRAGKEEESKEEIERLHAQLDALALAHDQQQQQQQQQQEQQ